MTEQACQAGPLSHVERRHEMKAIVHDTYGPPEVLELRDIAKPCIGDDDVLIRVHAAGLDPSVWHLMTGLPYLVRMMFGLRKPKTPVRGWDVSGVVEAIGKNVKDFRPGDEVFGSCRGAFAEYASARADRLMLKPANLTLEQAAAVTVSACTALQALHNTGNVQSGQHVLIIGAGGGVGTFAVQIAKSFGAKVTGVCSTTKTDLVRSIGADYAIDYSREDFADRRQRYDLILDMASNRSVSHLRRALTPPGDARGRRRRRRWPVVRRPRGVARVACALTAHAQEIPLADGKRTQGGSADPERAYRGRESQAGHR